MRLIKAPAGRVAFWGLFSCDRLSSPIRSSNLPCGIDYQVVGVDAAQAGGQVPSWRGAEGRLIRRGPDGGGDDCHALCAGSTAAGDGAVGNSGVAAAFLD